MEDLATGLVFLHLLFQSTYVTADRNVVLPARVWPVFIAGLAESPAALVLGFAVLSVVWLLVAVGMRRQA